MSIGKYLFSWRHLEINFFFLEVTCFVGFNGVEFFSQAKVASFGNIVIGASVLKR